MQFPLTYEGFELDGPRNIITVERTITELAPDQLLLRPYANAFCAGDTMRYRNEDPAKGQLGHEACGEVVAVGSAVRKFQRGMFVAGQVLRGDALADHCLANPRTLRVVDRDRLLDSTLLEPQMCTALSVARQNLAGKHVVIVGGGAMTYYLIRQMMMLPEVAPSLGFTAGRPASITVLVNREWHKPMMEAVEGVTGVLVTASMSDTEVEEALIELNPEFGKIRRAIFDGAGEWMEDNAGIADVVFEMAGTQRSLDTAIRLTKTEGDLHVVAFHQGAGGTRQINMRVVNLKGIVVWNDHWRMPATVEFGLDLAVAMHDRGLVAGDTLTHVHEFTAQGIKDALAVADERPDYFLKAAVVRDGLLS